MPIFDDDDQDSFNATGSGFAFSGVKAVDAAKLATEYTLVGIAADRSGSLSGFDRQIEALIINSLEGCQKSPRVDNLLARVMAYSTSREELHGFRPLADCHLANYQNSIHTGGCTVLYDASVDMIDSVATYGKKLRDEEVMANGIVVIITDGYDEGSKLSVNEVQAAIERARRSESLESVLTILIGLNVQNPVISRKLTEFKDKAGIDQYIEANDATPATFAKVAKFISTSVSSQSQALGTGGPSKPITF